jgi:hypothetical protein
LAAAVVLGPAVGHAQVIDPQIFIQQSGTAPAGGDPNIITDTSAFVVGVAGNFTLQNPLLVGIANYSGSGSISFDGVSAEPLATIGTYGITANTATLSAGQEIGTQIGFTQSGGSLSYTNLSAADVANGMAAPSSYSLQVFALPTNLTSGSTITIDTTAANGSFIFAFGCEDGTGSSAGCATNGNVGQTVFTNSALIDGNTTQPAVPEPRSLVLFGTSLALLGLLGGLHRRRTPPSGPATA